MGFAALPVIADPRALRARIGAFNQPGALSVPWDSVKSGPDGFIPEGDGYDLSGLTEFDPRRTFSMVWGSKMEASKRLRGELGMDKADLRRAEVMFASAPMSGMIRDLQTGGITYVDDMGDVLNSMTHLANQSVPGDARGDWVLRTGTPDYPRLFIEAVLGKDRARYVTPTDLAHFKRELLDHRPQVLMLSGLGVNTGDLLEMACFAREEGVKRIILGGRAAMGPYPILDEAMDLCVYGVADSFLYNRFVGDLPAGYVPPHPRPDRLTAHIRWLFRGADGGVVARELKSAHMMLRYGCTQQCSHCDEGIHSDFGRIRPPLGLEEAKHFIDEAFASGVRHIYFIDPDFWGTGHNEAHDLEAQVIRHLAGKGMTFSFLGSVRCLEQHMGFMIAHGLRAVYLGTESLSDAHRNRLKNLNRGWQHIDRTMELVDQLHDSGVMVYGLYMLGNPGETESDIMQGVDQLAAHFGISQISNNQPFASTAEFRNAIGGNIDPEVEWRDALKKGWIYSVDYRDISYSRKPWMPEGYFMSPERARELYVAAHRRVNRLDRLGGFFDRQEACRQVRLRQAA